MNKFFWLKAVGLVAAAVSLVGSFFDIGLTQLHTTKLMLLALLLLLGSDNAELREKFKVPRLAGSKLFKVGMALVLLGVGFSGFFGG